MYVPKIDIHITTMERPDCLDRLLKSIPAEVYEQCNVYIADQSMVHYAPVIAPTSVAVDLMPYDVGLSYARNYLLTQSMAPFVLLLEDDFEWTENTNLDKMLTLMEANNNVGVVGGEVRQHDHPINFEFFPIVKDGVLYHQPDGDVWSEYKGIRYKQTGCVLNFTLMRRRLFDDIQWDHDLKLREHQDFYLRLWQLRKWRVLYTTESVINDAKPSKHTPQYQQLKDRDQFLVTMMRKHGLHKIYYQNGTTRLLTDDGKIAKSNEAPLSP